LALLGGQTVRIITYINIHKALVPPIVVGLMAFYANWSVEAFVYLALHGTYAMLWLMKEEMYPDARFEQSVPLHIGLFAVFLPLAGYYLAPYLLISRHVQLYPWVVALAISIYTFGIFSHYVGDAQKFYTLRLRKGLIEDGLFARTRNPNYLGEILIYSAFALLSWHWLPFVVLGGWVLGFFVPNMRKKDRSLARHPEFAAYRNRSGLLIPKLFRPTSEPQATGSQGAR
jgi:protein-S-isoprenylcysteine O-methyltransferase Ste14